MRTTRTALALTTLVLLAACGGSGGAATVEPSNTGSSTSGSSPSGTQTESAAAGTGAPPDTELSISTSTSPEGAADQMTYLLTCDPAGGDHPDSAAACAVVAELGAEAFAPPPKDQQCTQQYGGPQTASVTGVVDGVPVQTTLDRTDGCGIARWDALATVLAAPVGGAGS